MTLNIFDFSFRRLLIFACNNYMYSSLCLRNGKIRSPLNRGPLNRGLTVIRMSALTTPHCIFRHLQAFVYKHLQAFVYKHLQLGKGISIYVTLKLMLTLLEKN